MIREKVDICFIILHYMDIELTDRAVQSILRLKGNHNSRVIIVDNASPNGSGKLLEKKYCDNLTVKIVFSDRNGGFSRGNNLGYQYCLEHYDMDFVIAANNDVIFSQEEFIPLLYECYEKQKFYVAGPDIFVPHRQYHQSPMAEHIRDDEEILSCIRKERKRVELYSKFFPVELLKIYCIEKMRENILFQKMIRVVRWFKPQKNDSWRQYGENVVLMGACIIFSVQYCRENRELFEPLTFMYGEEDFLALRCSKNEWNTIYYPKLMVLHTNQGSSVPNRISFSEFRKKKIDCNLKCAEVHELYIKYYRKSVSKEQENNVEDKI